VGARLGIAAGSTLGAEAAVEIAREGGNAVDACLAAAVMGWVAEPFFTSIGGSGFVAARTPEGNVEIIDGNQMMPFTDPSEPGQGIKRTFLDYSDGMYTGVGGGSVGVPGILAAVRRAWERHGSVDWEALFTPAIRAAKEGFPFPKTSAYYLSVTFDEIWSKYPEARALFSDEDGQPLKEGAPFVQPELGDSLESIAQEGPRTFYKGELAHLITDALRADGGFMQVSDLEGYEAYVRLPLISESFGWRLHTNPPPASGGASLVHVLSMLESSRLNDPVERLRAIAEAQRAATMLSFEGMQDADDIAAEAEDTAQPTKRGETTHSSSADVDGYACAITESAGYGAGLVIAGMLMNNTLGEEELNPLGVHGLAPGARCHTNMAPTIASREDDGSIVALGSPGATRIVGAIAQTFLRVAVDDMPLHEAVAAPRAHLDRREAGDTLCFEPGLPGTEIEHFLHRPYDEIHMFFGAVQAAGVDASGKVHAAHDPRRSGGSALI
jgi:gamma-glutamyltranspeptidase/glutathione hydrolase